MHDTSIIETLLKITGLSQKMLASELGYNDPSSLSQIKSGKIPMSTQAKIIMDYRFGHLYQWIEKSDGTKYIMSVPQSPPSAHDHAEDDAEGDILENLDERAIRLAELSLNMGRLSSDAIDYLADTLLETLRNEGKNYIKLNVGKG